MKLNFWKLNQPDKPFKKEIISEKENERKGDKFSKPWSF